MENTLLVSAGNLFLSKGKPSSQGIEGIVGSFILFSVYPSIQTLHLSLSFHFCILLSSATVRSYHLVTPAIQFITPYILVPNTWYQNIVCFLVENVMIDILWSLKFYEHETPIQT